MLVCCLLLSILSLAAGQFYGQPEQIHISYATPTSRYVTWVTFDNTTNSTVEYGTGDFNIVIQGYITKFVDGGAAKRVYYIHRALLSNLAIGNTYVYHVGSNYGWSAVYYFKVMNQTERPLKYLVFGDMGNKNAQSLSRMQRWALNGKYDMVLHVGDMAYNLADNNGEYGDQFFRQIEPIAAYIPYMTVPGNHESAYNFSHYVNRWTMPKSADNLFYSFDVGPVHYIGFSTEFYYYVQYGWVQIANQYQWLEEDLKKANANREKVPWIVTMGHRPMYCDNADGDDCTKFEGITRTGLPYIHAYGLEDLFYNNGVDIEIWAHEHSYERMWPVYNRTMYNGTKTPYTDFCAPVHIVTGSAGCQEDTDHFIKKPSPWSAFRSSDYGFTIMTVFNNTHILLEQISDNQGGKIIDSNFIIKHSHGPFSKTQCKEKGHYLSPNYVPKGSKPCKTCSEL